MNTCIAYTQTHTVGKPKMNGHRSKSLEDEKKERRISWGMDGEQERMRAAGKRRFSQELKRRRHTVSGDPKDAR